MQCMKRIPKTISGSEYTWSNSRLHVSLPHGLRRCVSWSWEEARKDLCSALVLLFFEEKYRFNPLSSESRSSRVFHQFFFNSNLSESLILCRWVSCNKYQFHLRSHRSLCALPDHLFPWPLKALALTALSDLPLVRSCLSLSALLSPFSVDERQGKTKRREQCLPLWGDLIVHCLSPNIPSLPSLTWAEF